jgi:hypothetical protein
VRDIAVLEEGPMRLGAGRHLVDAVPERVAWYRREVAFGPMYYDTPSPAADVLNASDLAFGTLLGAWGGRLMRRIGPSRRRLPAADSRSTTYPINHWSAAARINFEL